MDHEIYNVQFVLSHAVVTTVVPIDEDKKQDEEEIIKAAEVFLSWDGVDVSRAQDIIVERA